MALGSGIQEEKKALRARLRAQAAALDANYLAVSDEAICRLLTTRAEWLRAKTVFIYVSVGAEPDTRRAIKDALRGGKRVLAPRCGQSGVMTARRIGGLAELLPAPFGLLEPAEDSEVVPPEEIDLVVAPCLAADKAGRRLGNGGGYYDRYLAKVRCPVLCLCRGQLLQDVLPEERFDIPVSAVLAEDGVWPRTGDTSQGNGWDG